MSKNLQKSKGLIRRRKLKDRKYNCQKFEDIKGLIRRCKLKKDRKYNGQKKTDQRTSNDLQTNTPKTKD